MTQKTGYDLWQEYAESFNGPRIFTAGELKTNLETSRRERSEKMIELGRFLDACPMRDWKQRLALIAVMRCKSRSEWWTEDAMEEMRIMTVGARRHKSASEMLEQWQDKMHRINKTEQWYEKQLNECEVQIADFKVQITKLTGTNRKRGLRSAQNKLKHWQGLRTKLQCDAMRNLSKMPRAEYKTMKWLGVTEKIKIANTAKQIAEEKHGFGNKYGFNPKAQNRETAEIMFED